MTDDEILEKYDKIAGRLGCVNVSILTKRDLALASAIMQRTSFLSEDATLKERVFCIRNEIASRPTCPVCEENPLRFSRKTGRYPDGCCADCTRKSDAHRKRMLRKYGVESPNMAPAVKALKARHMVERYGVDNPSKMESVREKKARNSLSRHGVAHWTNHEKARRTYLERTGYENPSQNPTVKAKKSATCAVSLGCDNPSKSGGVKDKKKETCRRNNGVDYGFMLDRHVVYNSVSNLNRRAYRILDEMNIAYEREFRIYDGGTYRSYDVLFSEQKTFLELNGDFWHANPKKFGNGDKVNLPHLGLVAVDDIWKRDADKRALAERNGYRLLVLWEGDMNRMMDDELKSWIRENVMKSTEISANSV